MAPARPLALTSLDIRMIVRELQGLKGSRVSRIYGQEKTLILVLNLKNEGKRFLLFSLPGNVSFIPVRDEAPENPSGTIMVLRGAIEGMILDGVEQIGFDRIIKLTFSGKERYSLVFELFSHGNCFLLNNSGIIVSLFTKEVWKSRTLDRDLIYTPPTPAKDTPALDAKALWSAISASGRDTVVKALAVDCGLGGTYAEELCARAGIRKDLPVADTSQKDTFLLHAELARMMVRDPHGFVYPDAISPVPLLSKEAQLINEVPSFLEARALAIPRKKTRSEQELERQDAILKTQKDTVLELEAHVVDETRRGEWVYEHYSAVQAILVALRSGVREPAMATRLLAEHGFSGGLDLGKGLLTIHTAEGAQGSVTDTRKTDGKGAQA
jgi:predicted ribosome quality control (RQC) complex YloA/Tae2 family protein